MKTYSNAMQIVPAVIPFKSIHDGVMLKKEQKAEVSYADVYLTYANPTDAEVRAAAVEDTRRGQVISK